MRGRAKLLKYVAGAFLCLAVLALAAFSQRELLLTQLIGDGYYHGTIVDENGQPVTGAPVTLVAQRAYGIDCSSGFCDIFNEPIFRPQTVTDGQGRFTLHVPRRFLAERGKESLYIYKLQVEVTPVKTKLFYQLDLAARESTQQVFTVKPPFLMKSEKV